MCAYLESLETIRKEKPKAREAFGDFPLLGIVWFLRHDELRRVESWDPTRLHRQFEFAHQVLVNQDFVQTDNDYQCKFCPYRKPCRGDHLIPLDFKQNPSHIESSPKSAKAVSEPLAKQLKLPHKKGESWFRSDIVRGIS